MKRNMTFIAGAIIIVFSSLLFAEKSKGDEVPVTVAMKNGIKGCLPETSNDVLVFSGILIVLTDAQRAVFNSQIFRMFGAEVTRSYSSAKMIVAQVNPSESETLRSQDFSYRPIGKNDAGAWCYANGVFNGYNTVNFTIARALSMRYEP